MVTFVRRLRHWLADESVVHECRNCGTPFDEYPACGADDIVAFGVD
jgi:hypothetical protein